MCEAKLFFQPLNVNECRHLILSVYRCYRSFQIKQMVKPAERKLRSSSENVAKRRKCCRLDSILSCQLPREQCITQGVTLVSKLPRSKWTVDLWGTPERVLVHRPLTWQSTGCKRSAVNVCQKNRSRCAASQGPPSGYTLFSRRFNSMAAVQFSQQTS